MPKKYEIYKSNDKGDQNFRWRLRDGNNKIIAVSEEPFHKDNILASIKKIRAEVNPNTPIFDKDDPQNTNDCYRFVYFQSENDEQWYWRLLAAGNSEKMAIGGEGFSTKQSVIGSLENVRDEMPNCFDVKYENPEDDPLNDAKDAEKESGNKTTGMKGS